MCVCTCVCECVCVCVLVELAVCGHDSGWRNLTWDSLSLSLLRVCVSLCISYAHLRM